jgi:hypothetical protein
VLVASVDLFVETYGHGKGDFRAMFCEVPGHDLDLSTPSLSISTIPIVRTKPMMIAVMPSVK